MRVVKPGRGCVFTIVIILSLLGPARLPDPEGRYAIPRDQSEIYFRILSPYAASRHAQPRPGSGPSGKCSNGSFKLLRRPPSHRLDDRRGCQCRHADTATAAAAAAALWLEAVTQARVTGTVARDHRDPRRRDCRGPGPGPRRSGSESVPLSSMSLRLEL